MAEDFDYSQVRQRVHADRVINLSLYHVFVYVEGRHKFLKFIQHIQTEWRLNTGRDFAMLPTASD